MPEIAVCILYTRTTEENVTRTLDSPQEVLDRTKGEDGEELDDVLHEYLTDHEELWDLNDDEAEVTNEEITSIDEIEIIE